MKTIPFGPAPAAFKGRGSFTNERSRFDAWRREPDFDGGGIEVLEPDERPKPKTTVWMQQAKSIITTNQSPDLPFDASINPYQGCEHGCNYCYARPSHAYLGLSPGLDFETRLFAKTNAAALLEAELSNKNYVPKVIALGVNTDAYQPIEREYKITRSLLEVLERFNHPVSLRTKSGVITRDIDILERMAKKGLVSVYVSITTLQNDISRTLEPRASSPARRLETVRRLVDAGIPTGVQIAPIIPAITDMELEAIVSAAAQAGATRAAYTLLRLPREVSVLFEEWLHEHFPDRAQHVMSLISQMRGGKVYDAAFGSRMKGTGIFAELLRSRFHLACRKNGMSNARVELRTDLFSRVCNETQMALF